MNLDDFRAILENSGVNIWGFIDTAIEVANLDYGDDLSAHRDGIVAKLYSICPNCDPKRRVRSGTPVDDGFVSNNTAVFGDDEEGQNKEDSPYIPVSIGGDLGDGGEDEEHQEKEQERRFIDDDDIDGYDEQRRIISIKEQIEDPHQTEDSLIDLLQILADMDVTFKALQETDIGRHVNRLRKHPSNGVRNFVKMLVRRWKDLVDDWVVRSNTPGVQSSSNVIVDGDSPLQNVSKSRQNGHHNQGPDFGYSPNPHNGNSSVDKSERKPKAASANAPPLRRDPPAKPIRSASPVSAPPPSRQKEVAIDPARLASARKRLQENYQEAQNAKKQRTIQVMDIHEIPKPKNSFFGRNKGGFQRH